KDEVVLNLSRVFLFRPPPISVAVLDSVFEFAPECRRNRNLLFLPRRRLLHSVVNKTAATNQPLPLERT
ncbi:unnamed protein product, partial [Brassica oleracea var. botrytis]